MDAAPGEEEATATDTQDEDEDANPGGDTSSTDATPTSDTATQFRKKALEFIEVQQAIEKFPDEPIVRYHWPDGKLQTLYAQGRDAVKKFYQLDKTIAQSKQGRFTGKINPRTIPEIMQSLADEIEGGHA